MGKSKRDDIHFLDGKGNITFEEALRRKQTGIVPEKKKKKTFSDDENKNKEVIPDRKEEKDDSNTDPIEVAMGLDVSTSTIGICLIDIKKSTLIALTHKKLTKYEDEYEKGDNFCFADLGILKSKYVVRKIYIEEAAKKFTPGFSSANTIMTLGRFNGIISYMTYKEFGIKPVMVNVRSARAKIGIKVDVKDKSLTTKQKVVNQVLAMIPDDSWWDVKINDNGEKKYSKACEDRADAFVICKGGLFLGL